MATRNPLPPTHDDVLTGLLTASGFRAGLDAWAAQDSATGLQAMLVGFPRFHSVNLAYGEAAGDLALGEIAHRIREFCAEELAGETLLARIGGRDFLLASQQAMSRERWQWLAQALLAGLSRPIQMGGEGVRLSPRIALLRGAPGEGAAALFDRLAQTQSQLQKQRGRRLLWADGSHLARSRSAARLEADLLGAIDRREIGILFQPQFDTQFGGLVGAEELARWDHPDLGRIGAGTLFAVADRADIVAPLSRHIIQRALELAASWTRPLRLSLNVTAEDFAGGDFGEGFAATLSASGFPPERLTLEITEQALIHDLEGSAQVLRALAEKGVCIALDDFGTGFSNFRYLKVLPVGCLKLDRSIVRDIASDPRDRAILRALVGMAKALDLTLVAEGVEEPAQLAILRQEGCHTYQGYLASHPLDSAALMTL
jgi:predicted signal transduction protein with EAL and GGDEF domain